LDGDVGVCFSTRSTLGEGTQQGGEGQVQDLADSASVAEEALVHPAALSAVAGTSAAAGQNETIDAAEGEVGAPQPSSVQVGSLASVRKSYRKQGFSRVSAKLLESSVQKSTRTVYAGRFQEFVRWCGKRNEDPCAITNYVRRNVPSYHLVTEMHGVPNVTLLYKLQTYKTSKWSFGGFVCLKFI
jgi:hypothetical protein